MFSKTKAKVEEKVIKPVKDAITLALTAIILAVMAIAMVVMR